MVRAILLILEPTDAWDRIVLAQRSLKFVFGFYLLPTLLILVGLKGIGLVELGKWQSAVGMVKIFTVNQAVIYEAGQLLLTLLVIAVCAHLVKIMGETFHSRHTYTQAFTVIGYGLSPLFLLQLLGVLPGISAWMPWGIGILLSVATLYHGLPRVLRTDPSHSFSFYLISVLLIIVVTGFKCFITAWYLSGRFPALDNFISQLAVKMPF